MQELEQQPYTFVGSGGAMTGHNSWWPGEKGPPFHFYSEPACFPLVTDPHLSLREIPHPESTSPGHMTQSWPMMASYFLGQHDSGLGQWSKADKPQSIL